MTGTASITTLAEIRAAFPALERQHNGVPVAYFDGPGGTQVPRPVVDAMVDYLYRHNANTHWDYPSSAETDAILAQARQTVADFLNASPEEIVFGANMTTNTFHLARALGRTWQPGDEVVVMELDHHGNIAPWQALAVERGIVVRAVPFDPTRGVTDLDLVRRAIGSKTRLVAVGAASNAIGTITDVARVCELARSAGALSHVDAVHYAPHELVDVAAIGCDFLSCSPYKFYGPHLGVLFGRRELLERAPVPKLEPAPDSAPERFETGTQSHEAIAGAAAAVDFLAGLAPRETRRASLVAAYRELKARADRLVERLWDGLRSLPNVRLFGRPPGEPRTPTVAFVVAGVPADQVTRHLAARGVFVSHGDFYAATVIDRLGQRPHGVVRAGCSCYSSMDEVERLLEGVAELAGKK